MRMRRGRPRDDRYVLGDEKPGRDAMELHKRAIRRLLQADRERAARRGEVVEKEPGPAPGA